MKVLNRINTEEFADKLAKEGEDAKEQNKTISLNESNMRRYFI